MKCNHKNILKLTDIKISHQPVFKRYSENSELWMHFFLYLFLNKVKWAKFNKTLCIFQKDFFDRTWQLQSLPLGEGPKVIETLNYLINKGVVSKILFATTADLNLIKKADRKFKKSVKIGEDFIYKTKDLINLNGNKYGNIRRLISKFKKSYQYKFIDCKKEHFTKINKFLEVWYKDKTRGVKEAPLALKEDFKNTKNALKHLKKLNDVKSILLKNEDKIIGLAIFGALNKNMNIEFIIKTAKEYKGISYFLMHEIVKGSPEITYLNFGGCGKSESLKTHKMRLHPVKINSIYKVYF